MEYDTVCFTSVCRILSAMTADEALPPRAAVSLHGVMFVSDSAHGSVRSLSVLRARLRRVLRQWEGQCAMACRLSH